MNRANALIFGVFVYVGIAMAIVMMGNVRDEFEKTILSMIVGRLIGYMDQIFSFEFGTTKGAEKKNETINQLSQTVATQAAAAPTAPIPAADVANAADSRKEK